MQIDDRLFHKIVRGKAKYMPYLTDTSKFQAIPRGWILHVTVMNGSPHDLFAKNVPGSRKFSTGWVSKTGAIEFYSPLNTEPWAQVDGNSEYWAFETEGFPTEPLTNAQIRSLARIHAALELFTGRDYSHVIDKPGQVGVGTHQMGGVAWGNHACPGAVRAGQRQQIIDLAQSFRFMTPKAVTVK